MGRWLVKVLSCATDTTSSLSRDEKLAIDAGIQDMEAGKMISHQEAKQNTQARYPHLKPKAWK